MDKDHWLSPAKAAFSPPPSPNTHTQSVTRASPNFGRNTLQPPHKIIQKLTYKTEEPLIVNETKMLCALPHLPKPGIWPSRNPGAQRAHCGKPNRQSFSDTGFCQLVKPQRIWAHCRQIFILPRKDINIIAI